MGSPGDIMKLVVHSSWPSSWWRKQILQAVPTLRCRPTRNPALGELPVMDATSGVKSTESDIAVPLTATLDPWTYTLKTEKSFAGAIINFITIVIKTTTLMSSSIIGKYTHLKCKK